MQPASANLHDHAIGVKPVITANSKTINYLQSG